MYDVIAVTNRKLCKQDFYEQIKLLISCRIPKLILREKDLDESEYAHMAEQVLDLCRGTKTECILHTYADTAVRLGADAIHLPLQTAEKEREKLRGFHKVGISVHSLEQVRFAEELGASYVTYGHVFETDCKKGVPPRGIAALEEICRSTSLPVYGIGGIQKDNLSKVLQAGAKGVCVMSSAMQWDKYAIQQFLEL